uniref:Uncharacterized protein n=1 Tax=Setaria viridis TaxID=4556 RepID=A0A4U6UZM6_SETVI|nr:hypothetical protein SEVIR_4G159100v2 [Setaria viridis]
MGVAAAANALLQGDRAGDRAQPLRHLVENPSLLTLRAMSCEVARQTLSLLGVTSLHPAKHKLVDLLVSFPLSQKQYRHKSTPMAAFVGKRRRRVESDGRRCKRARLAAQQSEGIAGSGPHAERSSQDASRPPPQWCCLPPARRVAQAPALGAAPCLGFLYHHAGGGRRAALQAEGAAR